MRNNLYFENNLFNLLKEYAKKEEIIISDRRARNIIEKHNKLGTL